ncbi:hypothetical protein QR680_015202 [Steinernema hermaphroditum]|uniref:HAT C-terminal dimerisation domain-containing protein n=1 Tax=Steinernema hermaphroditum TaxID=289476 RepID=A0AA39M4I3_9BILA|nr:hypothetical protein QR680_015202 [Steinernema hermaphroditum]
MSLATASSGPPEAKKFRFSLPTPSQIKTEESTNFQVGAFFDSAPSPMKSDDSSRPPSCSAAQDAALDMRSTPATVMTPTSEPGSLATTPQQALVDFLSMYQSQAAVAAVAANTKAALLKPLQASKEKKIDFDNLSRSALVEHMRGTSNGTPPAPIPGAIAVAASPAAALFGEDDWSWHRNPAAAIRSGGTNKQTPVWKYFVYNKAENLSRCIIGDCTYMLKGPHTSTLACHLKKHPAEYAEFQKLKVEYTRERANGFAGSSPQSNASGGSNSNNSSVSKPPKPQSNNLLELSSLFNHNNTTTASNGNGTTTISEAKTSTTNGNSNNNNSNASNSKQNNISNLLTMLNARALASSQTPNSAPTTPVLQQIANPLNLLKFMNLPQGVTGLPFGNVPQTSMASAALGARPNPAAAVTPEQPAKKWPRQERKQRDLETKLALVMATAQVTPQLVNNPFFRDFMEAAQPKFAVPTEPAFLEELINGQHQRTLASIKGQLAAAHKVALLVDVLKVGTSAASSGSTIDDQSTSDGCDLDDSSVAASGTTAPRLCIFGSFYSMNTQKVEVVLMGIRALNIRDYSSTASAVKNCVESLMEEYSISMEKISRIVLNGLGDIGLEDEILFANQLDPVNHKLAQSLSSIFDSDPVIDDLRKHFYAMILSFLTRPDAGTALNKMAGRTVEFPVAESFFVLAEAVLEVKDSFLGACLQQPLDNPMEILVDPEWNLLKDATRLLRLFHNLMAVVQDGNFSTIDRVIPALKQVQNALDNDFASLGDLPARLKEDLMGRVQYIVDPESDDFDASFILATALNPHLAKQLDEDQLTFAKTTLERMLTMRAFEENRKMLRPGGVEALFAAAAFERKASNASTLLTQASSSSTTSSSTCSPPLPGGESTSNGTPSLYPDLILGATQRKQENYDTSLASTFVKPYFDELTNQGMNPFDALTQLNLSAMNYWNFQLLKNPQMPTPLAEIASELLCIPSCSVSVERLFGEGDNPTSFDVLQVLKALDEPERLERNAMLRFNRSHIPRPF